MANDPDPSPGEVRIREARPQDLSRITRVEAASYTTPWSPISLRSFLGREGALFLIAEEMGATPEIIGHGILRWAADEGELTNLAVAPDWRRRGIGGLLLDRILNAAPPLGLEAIFLEVRHSNHPALALYEGRGFRRVGVRGQYYDRPPEDAWILRLDLRVDRAAPPLEQG